MRRSFISHLISLRNDFTVTSIHNSDVCVCWGGGGRMGLVGVCYLAAHRGIIRNG